MTPQERATEFVKHYPNLFTEDAEWWAQTIGAEISAALSTAEQRIEEMRDEREKDSLKALEFGAAWFAIALDRQEDGSLDMTRCVAAFLAQREGK